MRRVGRRFIGGSASRHRVWQHNVNGGAREPGPFSDAGMLCRDKSISSGVRGWVGVWVCGRAGVRAGGCVSGGDGGWRLWCAVRGQPYHQQRNPQQQLHPHQQPRHSTPTAAAAPAVPGIPPPTQNQQHWRRSPQQDHDISIHRSGNSNSDAAVRGGGGDGDGDVCIVSAHQQVALDRQLQQQCSLQ